MQVIGLNSSPTSNICYYTSMGLFDLLCIYSYSFEWFDHEATSFYQTSYTSKGYFYLFHFFYLLTIWLNTWTTKRKTPYRYIILVGKVLNGRNGVASDTLHTRLFTQLIFCWTEG